jgi:hypothetical protein
MPSKTTNEGIDMTTPETQKTRTTHEKVELFNLGDLGDKLPKMDPTRKARSAYRLSVDEKVLKSYRTGETGYLAVAPTTEAVAAAKAHIQNSANYLDLGVSIQTAPHRHTAEDGTVYALVLFIAKTRIRRPRKNTGE